MTKPTTPVRGAAGGPGGYSDSINDVLDSTLAVLTTPQMFGARGDATLYDDTEPFMDMFDWVAAQGSGRIEIPWTPNGYGVHGLTVDCEGIQLVGRSQDSHLGAIPGTPFLVANASGDVLTFLNGNWALMQDLIVDGANIGDNAVVLRAATRFTFNRAGGIRGLQHGCLIDGSSTCNNVTLHDAIFDRNKGSGLRARIGSPASNTAGNNMHVDGLTTFTNNGTTASDASITAASPVATTTGALFAPWMQGMPITIIGAGPAGANLMSLIKTVDSSSQVTLLDNASTTVGPVARWSIGDGLTYANISLRMFGGHAAENKNWGVAFGDYRDGVVQTAKGAMLLGLLSEANLISNLVGSTTDGGVDDTYGIRCVYWPENSTDQGMALGPTASSSQINQISSSPGWLQILGRGRRGLSIGPGGGAVGRLAAVASAADPNVDIQLLPRGTGGVQIGTGARLFSGTGSPENVVTASRGALYLRTDGGANTSLYVKESGTATNTGWVAK